MPSTTLELAKRYFKIRGGIECTWYSYPRDDNGDSKKILSIVQEKDAVPKVTLDYLQDPTRTGQAVAKGYADKNYLQSNGGKMTGLLEVEAGLKITKSDSPIMFSYNSYLSSTIIPANNNETRWETHSKGKKIEIKAQGDDDTTHRCIYIAGSDWTAGTSGSTGLPETRVHFLRDPRTGTDAANKQYVDSTFAALLARVQELEERLKENE